MNNMNKGSKWSKYKNKATGDIVKCVDAGVGNGIFK